MPPPSLPPAHPLARRAGYCGQTDFGGDCSRGSLGAWEGVPSLKACTARCHLCERCRFVSFSRTFGDCSWYSACETTLLEVPHTPPGSGKHYTTVEVKMAVATPSAQGCQPQLQALWAVGAARPDQNVGCAGQLRRGSSPAVVVTSVGALGWARAEANGFRDTVLEKPLGAPVWLYHEASFQAGSNRSPTAKPGAKPGVCFVDLFEALSPLASLLTSPDR